MNNNILITGGGGMLGSYLAGEKPSHSELDITDLDSVRAAVKKYNPSVIIHSAAATDLTRCEKEPAYAYLTNSVGTYYVSLAARECNAILVYISTSGVFDGAEKDPYLPADVPNPLNVYGHSKYLGELAVRGVLKDFCIVRTSWLFGGGPQRDKKFVSKILEQKDNVIVTAVTDKYGSPTYAKDLAGAIEQCIKEDARGIRHIAGEKANRFEVAEEILHVADSHAKLVTARSNGPSAYATGSNESLSSVPPLRPWREALREYLESEWKNYLSH